MKNRVLPMLIVIGLWGVLGYIWSWGLEEMINITFLTGLISLTLLVIIRVIDSGFLDLFLNGFKRIGQTLFAKSNAMKRADAQLQRDGELQRFKMQMRQFVRRVFLNVSLSSFLLSCCALLIYYQ